MTAAQRVPPVVFVGAGPGDPDLVTRKGWRALEQADVVLYDALLDVDGFRKAAPLARWINVGKRVGRLSITQPFISKSLVNFALSGQRVVRLKGGDPAIFGRLAEELGACRLANIDVEIIPGVTAASSCAAELGISLTQRELARSVTFLTPRTSKSRQQRSEHWIASALHSDTVVFYMAGAELPHIAATLIAKGKHPHTPVAVIESASIGAQTLTTTLKQCAQQPPSGHSGPVTVIMGEVARSARQAQGLPIPRLEQLSDDIAVAAQITSDHVQQAADLGYRSIICNRPDGEEESHQTPYQEIAQQCAQLGLQFIYFPVSPSGHTEQQARQMREHLDAAAKPVLVYCRSGKRSKDLMALGERLFDAPQAEQAA